MTGIVRDDGTFTFPDVPTGDYYLYAIDPAILPVAQTLIVGRDDLKNVEMKVTDGVRVEGRILDRLKQPVGSANVTLKAVPGNPLAEAKSILTIDWDSLMVSTNLRAIPPNSIPSVVLSHLVLDPKPQTVAATPGGVFSFPRVLPGKYILEMNVPGGNSFAREIEVGIHESLNTTLDVPFTPVVGRIVHNDGSPLPKLTGSVRFVSMDPNNRILYAFPDDSGRFSALVASGEYRIFTDTLNVDRDIESISDGSSELKERRFTFDESRPQEIRITVAP